MLWRLSVLIGAGMVPLGCGPASSGDLDDTGSTGTTAATGPSSGDDPTGSLDDATTSGATNAGDASTGDTTGGVGTGDDTTDGTTDGTTSGSSSGTTGGETLCEVGTPPAMPDDYVPVVAYLRHETLADNPLDLAFGDGQADHVVAVAPAAAAIQPDRVAFAAPGTPLWIVTTDGTRVSVGPCDGAGTITRIQFSPDGALVAWVDDNGVHTASVDGDSDVQVSKATDILDLVWSPVSDRILLRRATGDWLVAAADGTAEDLLPMASSPQWSPLGDAIAYLGTGGVSACDSDGSNPRLLHDEALGFKWSPAGGEVIVYWTLPGNAVVGRVDDDGLSPVQWVALPPTMYPAVEIGDPFGSVDGRIAYACQLGDGWRMCIDSELVDVDQTVSPHFQFNWGYAWSPDGTQLVFMTNPGLYVADDATTTSFIGDNDSHVIEWSDDSTSVVYEASSSTRVSVIGGGSTIVGPPVSEGGPGLWPKPQVRWSQSTDTVFYRALEPDVQAVMRAPTDGSGAEPVTDEFPASFVIATTP